MLSRHETNTFVDTEKRDQLRNPQKIYEMARNIFFESVLKTDIYSVFYWAHGCKNMAELQRLQYPLHLAALLVVRRDREKTSATHAQSKTSNFLEIIVGL